MKKYRFTACLTALLCGSGMMLNGPFLTQLRPAAYSKADVPLAQSDDYEFRSTCSYMYDRMDAASKSLYDALLAACKAADNSDDDIPGSISASASGVSQEAAQSVMQIFVCDHPEFFWLDGTGSASGGSVSLNVISNLTKGDTRRFLKYRVISGVDDYLANSSGNNSDYGFAKALFDLIAESVYNRDCEYPTSILSPLLQCKSRSCGYAKLYGLLCNAAGVDCLTMCRNGEYWNAVKISGTWYYTDVSKNLFMMSKQEIENATGASYTPDASYYSGNYPLSGGVVYVPTEPPTEEPTEPPTEEPTEPPTEEPTEPPTEEPTEPPTEEPTEPPTEEPTEPPTEQPTEPPTELPTEPQTDPTEPPTETPTEPWTDPTEPPTEPPTQPQTDPTEPPQPWTEVSPTQPDGSVVSYRVESETARYYADDTNAFQPWSLIRSLYKVTTYSDGSEKTEQVWDFNPIRFMDDAANPKAYFEKYGNGCYHGPIRAVYNDTAIEIGDVWIGRKGDTDLDGRANASDAAKVLIYAANVGAGHQDYTIHSDPATEQFARFVSCFNGEQTLSASVAAKILILAAEQGAHS